MSADAWQLLGLAPTDDVRAIKRAYATCLKRCRPEDDAPGFARLRHAYDFLLAQAAGRARLQSPSPAPAPRPPSLPEPSPTSAPPPAAAPAPVSAPARAPAPAPALRADVPPPLPAMAPQRPPPQIAAEVIAAARAAQGHDASVAYARWLAAHAELMLLDRKPMISRLVLAEILRGPAPAPEVFAKLQAFFHWDDRLEQRRLAQVGLPIEAALGQVEATELRRVLALGVARKRPIERGLEAARRAGTGRRAWWLALVRRQPHTVPQLLHGAIQRHGYRAVEQVFGADTLAFWQRAVAARPTRMQWIIRLARPLLIGVLIALLGLVLGALFAWITLNPGPHAARDAFTLTAGGMGWAGLMAAGAGMAFNALQLTTRWLKQGPLQRTHARWQRVRLRLALDNQWRRALPAAAALLALAWYWPAWLTPVPYLVLVGVLAVLHLRDSRSVLGVCFAALGAANLGSLPASPLLLAAAAMPPTLWLGHAIHGLMKRRRAKPRIEGTWVMLAGLVLAALFQLVPLIG